MAKGNGTKKEGFSIMGIINQILSGKVISYKFFKRNWGYIVILLTILIV